MGLGRMTHSTALLRARMVQDIYDIGHQKDYVFDMRSKKISEASQLQWHSKKCLCFVSTPNNSIIHAVISKTHSQKDSARKHLLK